MNRETIRQTLVELLDADTGVLHQDLSDGKNLRTDLGLDSVDLVSMISQVERRFRIRLSQEEMQTLTTVGSVLDLLQAKITTSLAA